MKILHIGQMIGGLDVYIRNSIMNLTSLQDGSDDLEFVIAHGRDDKSKPVECEGIPVKEYLTSLRRDIGLHDLMTIREMIAIIRAEKPDLIHCHSAKGGTIGRIAAWRTGVPVLYTPHAFSYLSTPSQWRQALYRAVERFTRFHSYVLACSHSEQALAIEKVGYDPSHALVWPNAVPDYSLREDKEISRGKALEVDGPYICYIGRPCYQKNMDLLVDVMTRVHVKHPEVKLLLLGVGYYSPDIQHIRTRLRNAKLEDAVRIESWLSHEDTLETLRHSLFYLSTSRYEGLPLSVIEAMSLGKAIVVTDVVGNRDCVAQGVNGFLASEADELAEACCRLIEDSELRDELGKNGRKRFESEFDISVRIPELKNCYRQVVNKKN